MNNVQNTLMDGSARQAPPGKRVLREGEKIKDMYLVTLLPRLKEEKTRSFITIVTTLVAISCFGFFAINPTLNTIAQLNKQLADNKYVDQQLIDKEANLQTLQTNYTALQNDLPIVFSGVPSTNNSITLLGQVQAIAQKTNVSLEHMQTLPFELSSQPAPVTGFTSYAFSIDATGQSNAINDFILTFNSFDRLATIDGLSFSKASAVNDTVRLNIKGKAYFKTL